MPVNFLPSPRAVRRPPGVSEESYGAYPRPAEGCLNVRRWDERRTRIPGPQGFRNRNASVYFSKITAPSVENRSRINLERGISRIPIEAAKLPKYTDFALAPR